MALDEATISAIVEAALMVAGTPLTLEQLLKLFDPEKPPERKQLVAALAQIANNCADRGFELKQIANTYRFQAKRAYAPWVEKLWVEKPPTFSKPLLETLAIIAYQQPITRAEIEHIRGVSVSSTIMKTLLERQWIKMLGRREVPGRPALYGTTVQFLDYFSLSSLEELPLLPADLIELESAQPVAQD